MSARIERCVSCGGDSAIDGRVDPHGCVCGRPTKPVVTLKPGDLCVLGGRSTFKVGYVVGPSRRSGKTTVKSFSANSRRFSNARAVADALLLPLPAYETRPSDHARTIRLATLASAAERRDLRDDKARRAAKQEAAQIEAAAAGKPIDPTLAAAIASNSKQRR